jgi:hypothetical protein
MNREELLEEFKITMKIIQRCMEQEHYATVELICRDVLRTLDSPITPQVPRKLPRKGEEHMIIKATIVMGEDSRTCVTGKTIEEVIAKIKEFHTMSEADKNYYAQKNELDAEMASGWWLKEKNT